MITRSEVLTRATTIWKPGTVPYSQSTIHQPDGYRQDCSGYVSMAWGIPPSENGGWGGQSTVTLVTRGYMREIPVNDLLPGDAVGNCGPGTEGNNGHIVLFDRWLNDDPADNNYYLWEQAGGVIGPRRRMVDYPYPGMSAPPWKAYRFNGITDDPPIAPGGIDMVVGMGPLQLPRTSNGLESFSIWPVNAGALPWGPAWASIFADLFGGRAKLRIAMTPGNDTWTFVGDGRPVAAGDEPTVIIQSGMLFNFAIPTGIRGLSVMRLPVDAEDTCVGSVSLSVEYGVRT